MVIYKFNTYVTWHTAEITCYTDIERDYFVWYLFASVNVQNNWKFVIVYKHNCAKFVVYK